jgi:hypothetical protein
MPIMVETPCRNTLKKSPLAHERNFSASLVRPTLGDVRDHIDSRKSDQGLSYIATEASSGKDN